MIFLDADGPISRELTSVAKRLLAEGQKVAIWSEHGEKRAFEFAVNCGLEGATRFLSKPSVCVGHAPRTRTVAEFLEEHERDDWDPTLPVVSVLLPSYNHAHRIEKQLKSIEAQSFKQFELIVVDDGSSDDTIGVCRRWPELVSKVVLHGKNQGAAAAINTAAKHARGKFYTWVSADNEMSEDWLSRLVSMCGPGVGVAYANYDRFDDQGLVRGSPSWSSPPGTWGRPYDPNRLISDQACYFGPAFLIRSSVWEAAGPMRGKNSCDYDHWLRIEEACWSSGLEIKYTDDVLCHYYGGNERRTVTHRQDYDAHLWQEEAKRRRAALA